MKYLLDTCVVSDCINVRYGVAEHLLSLSPQEIAVSSITVMEIEYGLWRNNAVRKKIQKPINDFISSVHVLPFDEDDARKAAHIRFQLKEKGVPIGPYDYLLGATALRRSLIFVTSNTKEFSRIAHLKLEDWRNLTAN